MTGEVPGIPYEERITELVAPFLIEENKRPLPYGGFYVLLSGEGNGIPATLSILEKGESSGINLSVEGEIEGIPSKTIYSYKPREGNLSVVRERPVRFDISALTNISGANEQYEHEIEVLRERLAIREVEEEYGLHESSIYDWDEFISLLSGFKGQKIDIDDMIGQIRQKAWFGNE